MAATFIPDTVEGFQADASNLYTRIVRAGMVTGLELAAGNDPDVLDKCRAVIGIPWFAPHPTRGDLFYTRLLVDPIRGAKSVMRVRLVYESNQFTGPPSAWIIRRRGFLTTESINTLFGSVRSPLRVGYFGPAWRELNGSYSPELLTIKPDTVFISVPRALRAISASALIYGSPPATDISEFVGCVNEGPFYGKDVGWWMLIEADQSESIYGGYHTIDSTILTRQDRNWAEVSILRQTTGALAGKFVAIDPSFYSTVLALPYVEGLIAPANNPSYPDVHGFIRVGPHKVKDFFALGLSFGTP